MQKMYTRCLRCNRKLQSEESKLLGYGRTCWEKFNEEDSFKELFPVSCLTRTKDTNDSSDGKGGSNACI